MRTRSRSVALVLYDEVEVLDVAAPLQALTLAGRQWNWRAFRIDTVARRAGTIATRNQLDLVARHPLTEIGDPELVLLPGGYGARRASDDEQLLAWLRSVGPGAEHLAAVGWGVLPLARAGLLDGRRVAAGEAVTEALTELAPQVCARDAALEVDGGMFTARDSSAALTLGLELVATILGNKQASAVASIMGHAWSPPPEETRGGDVRIVR